MAEINKRISYKPYKIEIAENIFLRICNGIYGNEIEVTDVFGRIMRKLLMYVHNSAPEDKPDEYDYKLNSFAAIGLTGNTGSRKTFIFNALQKYMTIDNVKYIRFNKYLSFNFRIISSRFICGEFQQIGYEIINKYSNINIICIDDLGAEIENCQHFGNKINIIEAILEERDLANKITHFSSNINILKFPEIFIEKYGERVYSRIIKNTNILELNDKDFRLIK